MRRRAMVWTSGDGDGGRWWATSGDGDVAMVGATSGDVGDGDVGDGGRWWAMM